MSRKRVHAPGAAALISGARRLLLFLHVSPDGDAIGSTLSMAHALRALGKEAWIVQVDPVPRVFSFLPGWNTLFRPWTELLQMPGDWDLALLLDCGDLARVGAGLPLVQRCRQTINIDHHSTNAGFAEYNWVDAQASAVGEQVFEVIRRLQVPLNAPIATCLYTAILTDTGQFRYNSTTPRTHRIAARLLQAGVKPYAVAEAIFENETVGRTLLSGLVLATLRLHHGDRIATLRVTRQMFSTARAAEDEVDGLVNKARAVTGVEVGILCREVEDGTVRVNLRSRTLVDVGRVAQAFGGGGHARAAGCTIAGTLNDVEATVVAAAATALHAEADGGLESGAGAAVIEACMATAGPDATDNGRGM